MAQHNPQRLRRELIKISYQQPSHRSFSQNRHETGTSNYAVVVGSSALVIVAAYLASFGTSLPSRKRQKPEADEEDRRPPPKFAALASKISELCQDYLSIVSDDEKCDSLQRIDHLLSMSTKDRLSAYEREWNAIHTDEAAKAMSERNQDLLRHHLLHQRNLVHLLTCSSVERKGSFSNICSDVVGRRLSEDELEEARVVARAEFEKLKTKKTKP
ncbi:hypothetical protein ACA910_004867 [Epithemia clementina (nom. ined.)]